MDEEFESFITDDDKLSVPFEDLPTELTLVSFRRDLLLMPRSGMRRDRSRMAARHIAAATGGVCLLLLIVYLLYQGGTRIYYDYYFFAQVKEHYIPPDTRQRVEDVIMVLLMMLALYVAFRLLKYSFAHR